MAFRPRRVKDVDLDDFNNEEIEPKKNSKKLATTFTQDLEGLRVRHTGQKKVREAFKKRQCLFLRAGRKFAKTTCLIEIAWEFAYENPGCIINICYPTITQGMEVIWDEYRIQNCDIKDNWMRKKWIKTIENSRKAITFANGSKLIIIGTWNEARGRGTQPDLLLVDEIQDCCPKYLDAMDGNLAAKNGRFVMAGTPPPIKNHYHLWEERIRNHKNGQAFHFSSYSNDSLPHLKEWLDNKKLELVSCGKEDVWKREFLAEDCFVSDERVLPDPNFVPQEDFLQMINRIDHKSKCPLMVLSYEGKYISLIFAFLALHLKKMYIYDYLVEKQVYDKTYVKLLEREDVKDKIRFIQENAGQRLRLLTWDPSRSVIDTTIGFSVCRKDPKWQDRGIPILREMMNNGQIIINDKLAELGVECQKLLISKKDYEIEKEFPIVCTLAVAANEYFEREKAVHIRTPEFSKYQALIDAGLLSPSSKGKGTTWYKQGLW